MKRFDDPSLEGAKILIYWEHGDLEFMADLMRWADEWCKDRDMECFFYKDFRTIYAKPKPPYDNNKNEHTDG